MTAAERVLWGDHTEPRRHLRRTVVRFTALVVAVYVVATLAARFQLEPVAGATGEFAWFLTLYGPPVAAAASTARRGGLLAALAVGPLPATVFWMVATLLSVFVGPSGDAPAWALAVVFAAIGTAGAAAGYAVVAGGRLALRRYREG
jgi:hypothetical protein